MRYYAGLVLFAVLIGGSFQGAGAQVPLQPVLDPAPVPGAGPQRVTAGAEYEAGSFRRFFMGDGYRDLWTAPIVVPVLDLRREAGGLKPIRVGGGFQTQTIHLRGGDDGYYLFRSINKAVLRGLHPDMQGTPRAGSFRSTPMLCIPLEPGWPRLSSTRSAYPTAHLDST